MLRFKPIVVLAVAAALVLTGCSNGSAPQQSGAPSSSSDGGAPALADSVTIAVSGVPGSLDASNIVWTQGAPFAQAVYDSLVLANGDGTVSPNLATEWSYNDTRTELTMKLRDDVTFSDGEKFDGQVAADNLVRNRDGGVSNAAQIKKIETVEVIDATTIVIKQSAPDPGILPALAKNLGMMQSPATFDDPNAATNPIGSGPYTLDTANTAAGSSYTFVMREDYWNPDAVHYNKIIIKVLADQTAMLNGLKANQFDVASVTGKTIAPLEGGDYSIESRAQAYQGLLMFDREGTITPALADVRVRQAINYAFDREGMVKALLDGHGAATAQIFDPDGVAFVESLDNAFPFDPEKARDLLAEAGYPDGFTMKTLSSTLFPPVIYTLMTQQLADVGITLEITDVGTNFAPSLFSGQYPAGFAQIPIEAADWGSFGIWIEDDVVADPFKVPNDPKLNEYLDTIRSGDPADPAVKEASQNANKFIVKEDTWYAPFYRVDTNFAVASDTQLKLGSGNIFPNLWTIQPK